MVGEVEGVREVGPGVENIGTQLCWDLSAKRSTDSLQQELWP